VEFIDVKDTERTMLKTFIDFLNSMESDGGGECGS